MSSTKRLDIVSLAISNHKLTDVRVLGNMLYYTAGENEHCHLKIFDPTGSHGAENAYAIICETAVPATERQLFEALEALDTVTNGQFELMEFNSCLHTEDAS